MTTRFPRVQTAFDEAAKALAESIKHLDISLIENESGWNVLAEIRNGRGVLVREFMPFTEKWVAEDDAKQVAERLALVRDVLVAKPLTEASEPVQEARETIVEVSSLPEAAVPAERGWTTLDPSVGDPKRLNQLYLAMSPKMKKADNSPIAACQGGTFENMLVRREVARAAEEVGTVRIAEGAEGLPVYIHAGDEGRVIRREGVDVIAEFTGIPMEIRIAPENVELDEKIIGRVTNMIEAMSIVEAKRSA